MTEDLLQDVGNDTELVKTCKHSPPRMPKSDILKRKLIETNFEVLKEYNDNKDLREFFAGTVFALMLRDFSKIQH